MEPIGNILARNIKQSGIHRQVESSAIVNSFAEVAEEVIGRNVAKKSQALYFKGGILNIACLSSVLSQELQLNQKKIINKINKKFNSPVVEKLRFLS